MQMVRKMMLLPFMAMLVFTFSACGDDTDTTTSGTDTGTATTDNSDQVLVLDESYNGSTMELTVGVEIVLYLDGNPTTGFAWAVTSDGAPVLKQQGEPDYVAESDLVGAGGTYTWKFDVVEAGNADLELVYSQPWGEAAAPDDTFKITVDAKE